MSSFHFMVERTRVSGDPSKREIAINAGVALSFWNSGLRSFVRPVLRTSHTVTSPPENRGRRSTATQPASVTLADLQLPVSFAQSCKDLDLVQMAANEAGIATQSARPGNAVPAISNLFLPSKSQRLSSAYEPVPAAVEPYVPVPLPTAPRMDVTYHPSTVLPPPVKDDSAARSLSEEHKDSVLLVSVNSAEVDSLVAEGFDNPKASAQSSSTPTKSDNGNSAQSIKKGEGVRKKISVKEYNSRKSQDRPWSSRRSSRSPNRRQLWSHAPPSGRSARRNRRKESPPRRLVLCTVK